MQVKQVFQKVDLDPRPNNNLPWVRYPVGSRERDDLSLSDDKFLFVFFNLSLFVSFWQIIARGFSHRLDNKKTTGEISHKIEFVTSV